jgi:hypothetical protein
MKPSETSSGKKLVHVVRVNKTLFEPSFYFKVVYLFRRYLVKNI